MKLKCSKTEFIWWLRGLVLGIILGIQAKRVWDITREAKKIEKLKYDK
jgi:hypothetical protein